LFILVLLAYPVTTDAVQPRGRLWGFSPQMRPWPAQRACLAAQTFPFSEAVRVLFHLLCLWHLFCSTDTGHKAFLKTLLRISFIAHLPLLFPMWCKWL
jgi:hypothetical protein